MSLEDERRALIAGQRRRTGCCLRLVIRQICVCFQSSFPQLPVNGEIRFEIETVEIETDDNIENRMEGENDN